MKLSSVKVFLETMSQYDTVKINQVFRCNDGTSLSIRCLFGTTTFEISNSHTQEVIQNDSIEKTAEYIMAYIASHDLSATP